MEVDDQRHAPAALPPDKKPFTRCTGCWVGTRDGLDRGGKSRPAAIRSPDRPTRSYTYYGMPADGAVGYGQQLQPSVQIYTCVA